MSTGVRQIGEMAEDLLPLYVLANLAGIDRNDLISARQQIAHDAVAWSRRIGRCTGQRYRLSPTAGYRGYSRRRILIVVHVTFSRLRAPIPIIETNGLAYRI
jgi:hypothetical protein